MFAKTIIDSDAFLDLPISAQALYFHLAMRADDDGFVNKPRAIMNMIGAKNDDAKLLVERKFILTFESGVVVIKHWMIHNLIRKDTYHETKYKFEKASLFLDENRAYSTNPCNDTVTNPLRDCNEPLPQVSIGKDSIGKSIDIYADSVESDTPVKEKKHKHGVYGWVKLTDSEYQRLVEEFGEIAEQTINSVDEAAQQTGNKNKWKDYNLVIRKAIKQGWYRQSTPAASKQLVQEEPSATIPEDIVDQIDKKVWERYRNR